MAFVRSSQLAMMKGLTRPKATMMLHVARMATNPTQPSGENGADSSSRRKYIFGAGAILAVGGLGYGLLKYDGEDVFEKISNVKEAMGFPKSTSATSGQGLTGTYMIGENQATCVGKDDCEKKCEDSACLRKMDKEEEMIAKANSELEKALKDVKPKAVEATDAALKAYCEATELVKRFMDKAYCAIEEDNLESPRFEEVWCEVYELAIKRCEKVKDAMNKGQCAWELLCRLREVIDNGKNCKYTQCNPLLLTAEETLLCAERELLNAKAKMDCIQSESKLVEQYRNLVEDFRRDLKAEVESLLTGSKDCKSTFTDNECAMVLTHAYKKVLRVQKELSQVQAKSFSIGMENIDKTLVGTKLGEMKEYYEAELIKALSRQNLLYQENFELAKQVLQSEFERRLDEKDESVEARHLEDLVSIYKNATSRISNVESIVKEQMDEKIKSEKSRKLWGYCNALFNQINFMDQITETSGSSIKINKDQLVSEFSGDNFAVQLLKTMPNDVETAAQLKNRFYDKIDKTCRNLGTFRKGEKFTLWKYAVGYVQGSLTSRCDGQETAPKSVFEILDRTAYHLRRGELLDAVSTLNKLEGLPREVCKDWIADARAMLETSQTLFALMIHANSQS